MTIKEVEESTSLLLWIIGLYLEKGHYGYIEEDRLRKLLLELDDALIGKHRQVSFEESINSLVSAGYIKRLESLKYSITDAGKKQLEDNIFSKLERRLGKSVLENLREQLTRKIAESSAKVNIRDIIVGMRCQVCGKRSDNPVTRKTCCVNKLYVFCSEACLQRWNRDWLQRQEQIIVKKARTVTF
jgi:hypothetical protein